MSDAVGVGSKSANREGTVGGIVSHSFSVDG